ncbi:MAG: hypothetical protein H6728_11620 [Myxococcales bacterium]|nr:hypothetical protein [Myxococcales bacterium]
MLRGSFVLAFLVGWLGAMSAHAETTTSSSFWRDGQLPMRLSLSGGTGLSLSSLQQIPSSSSDTSDLVRPRRSRSYVEWGFLFGIILGVPAAVISLIPMIGNLVAFSKHHSILTRRIWGGFGVVLGGLGTIMTTVLTVQMVLERTSAETVILLLIPQFIIHLTALVMGSLNLAGAARDEQAKKLAITPYWAPEAGGHHRAGLMFSWRL